MWRQLAILMIATGCAAAPSTEPGTAPAPGTDTTPIVDAADLAPTTATTDAGTVTGADPVVGATSAPEPSGMVPTGFARVAARVTAADGTVLELCLWSADTPQRRSVGLMGVTSLGDADGMAFRYDAPHTTQFWMKDTVLPLSIAFYGADGAYLDAFDMEPCVTAVCERYPTPTDFLVAVETTQGDLPDIGMVSGSILTMSDLPCSG